jgi:hypothetical protein
MQFGAVNTHLHFILATHYAQNAIAAKFSPHMQALHSMSVLGTFMELANFYIGNPTSKTL